MQRFCSSIVALALLICGFASQAEAQDYFGDQQQAALTYRVEGERSNTELIVVGSLIGAGLATGGLGIIFNLKSQSAANDVDAPAGDATSKIYDQSIDDRRQDASRFRTAAIVTYSIGGALFIAGVTAFIITHPPDRLVEYGSEDDQELSAIPVLVPIKGGAVLAKSWSF